MATGRKPQQDPGKKTDVHATNFRVANGGQECGYKAGELHGVVGHRTFAHKPCLRDYTAGKLDCPFCAAGLVPEWRGYVPIWDRDFTLRYCLIGPAYLETADVIPHREQVTLTRAKNPISPLVLRHERKILRELPLKAPWSEVVNMEDICLALWRDDALTQWVYGERKKNPAPVVKSVAVKSDGKPFSPAMQVTAKRYGADEVPEVSATVDEGFERIKKRAAAMKASANGKH